ncbi:hypothetical protein X797_008644 [Metarhizium robertsii]|uniref:Uncharacterized protein n=1 Tax=Metarhizium robertsii TaxID=568076 RepID=A0A014QW87_9HYPO|nr:hypothetical protein X797_008644 [Metarhizium robertsii]
MKLSATAVTVLIGLGMALPQSLPTEGSQLGASITQDTPQQPTQQSKAEDARATQVQVQRELCNETALQDRFRYEVTEEQCGRAFKGCISVGFKIGRKDELAKCTYNYVVSIASDDAYNYNAWKRPN